MIIVVVCSSCQTSSVVSDGLFQKRKYRPGFHFHKKHAVHKPAERVIEPLAHSSSVITEPNTKETRLRLQPLRVRPIKILTRLRPDAHQKEAVSTPTPTPLPRIRFHKKRSAMPNARERMWKDSHLIIILTVLSLFLLAFTYGYALIGMTLILAVASWEAALVIYLMVIPTGSLIFGCLNLLVMVGMDDAYKKTGRLVFRFLLIIPIVGICLVLIPTLYVLLLLFTPH